jgi:glutathione S-transferase
MTGSDDEATALDPSWPDFATPIELWGQEQSINTHKTALMMRMCEVPFAFHAVNIQKGDHKSAEYEARNPFGRVPTFRQGDLVLCQTINQLDYLARRTGRFGPASITERYEIENWANFANDYFSVGLARLRFINRFGAPPGLDGTMLKEFFRPNMLRGMGALERHLADDRDWIAFGRPSLAEFIVHPFVAVWRDAELDIADYPAVAAWLDRFAAEPGYAEPEGWLRAITGTPAPDGRAFA